jgi:hypothetical protein
VFIDVGDESGQLDTSTGVVTPLFTGVSPHGVAFVASPEPASYFVGLGVLLAAFVLRKWRGSAAFRKCRIDPWRPKIETFLSTRI